MFRSFISAKDDALPIRNVVRQIDELIKASKENIPEVLDTEYRALIGARQDFEKDVVIEERTMSEFRPSDGSLEREEKLAGKVEKEDSDKAAHEVNFQREEQALRESVSVLQDQIETARREEKIDVLVKMTDAVELDVTVADDDDKLQDEINAKNAWCCSRLFNCCYKKPVTMREQFNEEKIKLDASFGDKEKIRQTLIASLTTKLEAANKKLIAHLSILDKAGDSKDQAKLRKLEAQANISKDDYKNNLKIQTMLSFLRVYECLVRMNITLQGYAPHFSIETTPLLSKEASKLGELKSQFSTTLKSIKTRLKEFYSKERGSLVASYFYTNLFGIPYNEQIAFINGKADASINEKILALPGMAQSRAPRETVTAIM